MLVWSACFILYSSSVKGIHCGQSCTSKIFGSYPSLIHAAMPSCWIDRGQGLWQWYWTGLPSQSCSSTQTKSLPKPAKSNTFKAKAAESEKLFDASSMSRGISPLNANTPLHHALSLPCQSPAVARSAGSPGQQMPSKGSCWGTMIIEYQN